MRKKIQEKLIKFATRVPVFMYLTDYRERSLKDVITQLEPGLFKKVTGLDVKDFELLCSLGVFNANLMNDAIFKFKRYEDSSLSYTGIDKHEGKDIGGWDTVIKRAEYDQLFYNQQATMEAPTIFEVPAVEDIPVPSKKPVTTSQTRPTPVSTPIKPKTNTSVTYQHRYPRSLRNRHLTMHRKLVKALSLFIRASVKVPLQSWIRHRSIFVLSLRLVKRPLFSLMPLNRDS